MGLPKSLSKTGLYIQGRNWTPNWVLENSRLVSFGLATNAPTGAPPRAPWGTPSCRDLPQTKDQVDRTTLGPPTNASGGGVRVNLVQTGWCELKSRRYCRLSSTGAPTKTFVSWLDFCTYTTYRPHGFSTSCSRHCMFLLLPAQIRTCCVRSVNVVCWDIWHDHVRTNNKWLATEKYHPDIREGPIKPQPLTNWHSPSRGLAVSTSGLETT
jgi:hypothetical protein